MFYMASKKQIRYLQDISNRFLTISRWFKKDENDMNYKFLYSNM